MRSPFRTPAPVIIILWAIAIAATTFLFMGSPNIVYGIVIQGICMIGSAAVIRNSFRGTG